MALRVKKAEAVRLRKEGATYSEIKERLQVSKSSLSLWLRDMPLSEERMREVRDKNPLRIERCRVTKANTRKLREIKVAQRVASDIETLSKRDVFIGGLFLYWGEGGKTKYSSISLSNTDPAMIRFYLKFL